jgi:very-short-patch-repair endonuclease
MASEEWLSIEQIVNSNEFKEWFSTKVELNVNLQKAASYFQMLTALKKFYLSNHQLYLSNPFSWVSSYPYDWKKIMTPIEFEAWQTIRCKGRIVLYPQYPVLNYHLDFGNPALRIGLELDGAQYHNEERDRLRDTNLNKSGWKIYRISGKEMCRTNYTELFDLSEEDYDFNESLGKLRYWLFETGDGIIQAIKEIHFTTELNRPFEDDALNSEYFNLCEQTLQNHQLIYGKNN